MADAGIFNDDLNFDPSTSLQVTQSDIRKRIDLIFCSVTSNCLMNLDQFLQAILKLVAFKYPHHDQQSGLSQILDDYFLPLHATQ